MALATGRNAAELEAQARRLRPAVVALADEAHADLDLPAGTRRVRGDDALERSSPPATTSTS